MGETVLCSKEDFSNIRKSIPLIKSSDEKLLLRLKKFSTDYDNNQNTSSYTKEYLADLFRDVALSIERLDLNAAYHLMLTARMYRQNVSLIILKIAEYELLINTAEKGRCVIEGAELEFGPTPPFQLLKALTSGNYEKYEVNLLKQYLEEDDVVLEVGAGIGFMGIVANKELKCESYTAFEANPDLIPIIKNNLNRNGVSFDVRNGVLYNRECMLDFYITPGFWASSLSIPHDVSYKTVSVRAFDKNKILQSLCPTMLIVDIEGGEKEFFEDLNLSGVKKLILEIHPSLLKDSELVQLYSILFSSSFLLDFKSSSNAVLYWYKRDETV